MRPVDREDDQPDELTERYRAAAAADPARPSEATRRAILAHAHALSADRAVGAVRSARSGFNHHSWRLGAAASVAVVAIAAVLAWKGHVPATSALRQASTPAPAEVSTREAAGNASALPPQPQEPSPAQPSRSLRARSAAASAPPPPVPSPSSQTSVPALAAASTGRSVDWTAVGPGSPIPASMPSGSSDDPLEAGFSAEWARRALKDRETRARSADLERHGLHAPPDTVALALEIMSQRRAPGDQWAHEVERQLRDVIRTKVDSEGATVSRVFCNAVGCLCYTERAGANANQAGFTAVSDALTRGGWAREFGIEPQAVYLVSARSPPDSPDKAIWQLILVMRNESLQN